jgi:hypothetical protein
MKVKGVAVAVLSLVGVGPRWPWRRMGCWVALRAGGDRGGASVARICARLQSVGWSTSLSRVRLWVGRGPMTCRSAGVLGLMGLPRDLPFEGLCYACPGVTLAPALFFGAVACQSRTVRT